MVAERILADRWVKDGAGQEQITSAMFLPITPCFSVKYKCISEKADHRRVRQARSPDVRLSGYYQHPTVD